MFAQHLQLFDQYKLAQVSTAFRNILKHRFNQRTLVKVSSQDWLLYLATRGLFLPDYWVCEQCNNLHPYEFDDIPSSPANLADPTGGCPVARKAAADAADAALTTTTTTTTSPPPPPPPPADFVPLLLPCSYRYHRYHLRHRHVQLALKYQRKGGSSGPYAQRLAALLRGGDYLPAPEQDHFSITGFQNRGFGRYSWKARITACGRFLLRTRLEFYPARQELGLLDGDASNNGLVSQRLWDELVPAIRMCQHQMWMPLYNRRLAILLRFADLSLPAEGGREFQRLRAAAENGVALAVEGMRQAPLKEACVSCMSCATDVAMQWSASLDKYRFTATAWHDFGSYTSPSSTLWTSKHADPMFYRRTSMTKSQTPGRVRKLWDECSELSE